MINHREEPAPKNFLRFNDLMKLEIKDQLDTSENQFDDITNIQFTSVKQNFFFNNLIRLFYDREQLVIQRELRYHISILLTIQKFIIKDAMKECQMKITRSACKFHFIMRLEVLVDHLLQCIHNQQ